MDLSVGLMTLIIFVSLAILLFSGMPIAFGLMAMGIIGIYAFLPRAIPGDASIQAFNAVNSFTLTACTMYIFMGELLVRSRVSEMVYQSLEKILGKLPGGLLHAVIVFCALFAAVSGSSVATAAMIGTVALPSMKQRRYDPKLMYGAMAAGGTLGILIPPSVIMIIYGALAGVSIAKCFFAGIIPGIILGLMFMGYVAIQVTRDPSLAPTLDLKVSWKEKFLALGGIAPVFLLAVIILGGIYMGIWTPTEAAALGCVAAIIIIIAYRRMNRSMLIESLRGTLYSSSMLTMILAGAGIISYVISYLRIPNLLAESIVDMKLSPHMVLAAVCLIYYIMGCFIEGICMVIITVPIIFPVMMALGFDPVWFAVVLTINIEVGLITAPVGMNLYILKGIDPEGKFEDIAMGSLPFVIIMTAMLVILAIFPKLATWLPDVIGL